MNPTRIVPAGKVRMYAWALAAIWTVVAGGLMGWSLMEQKRYAAELAAANGAQEHQRWMRRFRQGAVRISVGYGSLWLLGLLGLAVSARRLALRLRERNEAMRDLDEQRRFLEDVFEAIQDGVSVLDRQLRIVRVNGWMEQMYYHQTPLTGRKCYEAYQLRKEVCPWCPSVKALASGKKHTAEVPYQTDKGVQGWMELTAFPLKDESGRVTGILEHVRDISAQKAAQVERERLAAAIHAAAEIVVITDAEGTIQYVNPAFERCTGYSHEEAIGQNPRLLKSGEHDEAFYQELWRTITSGRVWEGRFVNKRKDGSLYHERAVISPVRDADGRIVSFVAVKSDITREMRREMQLRHAQKMEAIGQLAGGVAHDFNNLLQAIVGYTDLIMLDPVFQRTHGTELKEIRAAADRAARLTRQLLAFARRETLEMRDLNLNSVVEGMLNMLGRLIGRHIEIEFVPGAQLGTVHADEGQMEQIMMNLCVNARDAMPEGGRITIETENVLIGADYCRTHPWARPGRYVLLSVTDTGCGMDDETLTHVFEPFYTTKDAGRGTGLGMATVYGIVKQHNGMISAYSEKGKGTTFKIYLPIVERPAESVGPKVQGPVVGGSETILLAEDSDAVRQLAAQVLRDAGYAVFAVRDGAEAEEVFAEHADEIDLLVLDVVMPRRGGKDAYDAIRKVRPDIPCLFCSGYSENSVHTDFVLKEGMHLLKKPYAPNELLRRVRERLDEAKKQEG